VLNNNQIKMIKNNKVIEICQFRENIISFKAIDSLLFFVGFKNLIKKVAINNGGIITIDEFIIMKPI
jgi:hypothetical protein